MKYSVVIFIPEAGIYPYLRSLDVLGSAVMKNGGEVFITRCTGQMKRCIMMDMNQAPTNITPKEKDELCKKCSKNLEKSQKKYGFKIINLSDFVDDTLEEDIDNLLKVPVEDKENLRYRGFPVGKMGQFDFTLATKYLYQKYSIVNCGV
jgi:hypothetical protein